MDASPEPRKHDVRVMDIGGCCDDHPSYLQAFCYDCGDSVGGDPWDWSSAEADAEEHRRTAPPVTDL